MSQHISRLFGAEGQRLRPGHPDTEWSVWITGMDDIHDKRPDGGALTLLDALILAAGRNSAAADLRSRDEHAITIHAVVLHWGYAWTPETEHAHRRDCGVGGCGPCSFGRVFGFETEATR